MGRLRSRLCVETLEGREVPAGTVNITFSGNSELFITLSGDNLDNDVLIELNSNDIRITGNAGTTLNYSTTTLVGGWSVDTTNSTSSLLILVKTTSAVLGGINANMGQGNDRVDLQANAVLPINNNLTVDMGQGNDLVNITGTATTAIQINGDATFNLGNDNDAINIEYTEIYGNLIISEVTYSGNDQVRVSNSHVYLDTQILLAKGNDGFYIDNSIFNNLTISAAGGNDTVVFMPGATSIYGNLDIITGGGNDRVIVFGSGSSASPNVSVTGITRILTGGGNDLVRFGTSSSTGSTVGLGATVIRTGAGNDKIYMRDAIMSLLIALLDSGDDQVINNWGADNVTVGFGSLLDGGTNTPLGDNLSSPWSAPANLTVVNFP
jgi:hypothetical protein